MQNKSISPKPMNKRAGLIKGSGISAFAAALLAIVLGLIFGYIVMIAAKPANSWYGFTTMLFGGFNRLGDVFYYATPIMMTGLSVGFAFKMGLFNIGASGQYTMGMFFALYVGFMWDLPDSIRWIVCILAGLVGGMLWGFIPGILKALANVNEVITSIMFNYIGMYLVDMMIQSNGTMYVSTKTRTAYLPKSAQIPSLGVPDSNVNISIIFAILIAVILFIVLNKTIFGYELKATGYNKHASKYAGMNDKRNTIYTMLIAGALSGLGGAFAILAPSVIEGSSMTYEPINVIAVNGFNGIAVALLGSSNPIGIIFSALFISHIQRGGTIVSSLYGYKPEIIDVVVAVIIYFSAFAMLMNSNVAKLLKKRGKAKDKKSSTLESAAAVENVPTAEAAAQPVEEQVNEEQTNEEQTNEEQTNEEQVKEEEPSGSLTDTQNEKEEA